jgi:hypothetical protein
MQIVVHEDSESSEDSLPSDLVMAWASDITTGEPRYIGELKEQQGGASCHCKWLSCHQPLIAVNAGKRFYKRRPHFRHHAGSEKNTCLVLTARAAALSMLQQEGVLQLPQLRKSAVVTGLSGTYHSAWIERPAEQVKIDRVVIVFRSSIFIRRLPHPNGKRLSPGFPKRKRSVLPDLLATCFSFQCRLTLRYRTIHSLTRRNLSTIRAGIKFETVTWTVRTLKSKWLRTIVGGRIKYTVAVFAY